MKLLVFVGMTGVLASSAVILVIVTLRSFFRLLDRPRSSDREMPMEALGPALLPTARLRGHPLEAITATVVAVVRREARLLLKEHGTCIKTAIVLALLAPLLVGAFVALSVTVPPVTTVQNCGSYVAHRTAPVVRQIVDDATRRSPHVQRDLAIMTQLIGEAAIECVTKQEGP